MNSVVLSDSVVFDPPPDYEVIHNQNDHYEVVLFGDRRHEPLGFAAVAGSVSPVTIFGSTISIGAPSGA